MLGSPAKTVTHSLLVTLCLSVLLLAGCDLTEGDDQTDSEDYEVTDDLGDRIEEDSSNEASAFGKAQDELAFNLNARIKPPTVDGVEARATSLTYDGVHTDGNNIYIGYLLWQDPFGGGIDIVDARNPTDLSGAVSLKADSVDVQAIASPLTRKDKIYVAEAVSAPDPDETPSRVSIIEIEDGADGPEVANVQSQPLSGWVAKTATVEPANAEPADENLNYLEDFYVTDDSNRVYRYKKQDLEGYELIWETPSPAEFSGITSTYTSVFAMTIDGDVYGTEEWAQDEPDATMDHVASFASPSGNVPEQGLSGGVGEVGIERLGIGRLSAADTRSPFEDISNLQGPRLFAGLGYGGFAVLDDNGGSVHRFDPSASDQYSDLADDEKPYYTSVALHGNVPAAGGDDFLYAARRHGAIDVYRVPSGGISNMEFDRTLYIQEAFDLGESDGATPSVNYVVGVDGSNQVFVSGGIEGTLILTLGQANPKAISFAAFCGGASSSDLSYSVSDRNDEGEPIEMSWDGSPDISTVVLKSGNEISNFDGSTGSARSESGETASRWQSPRSPCPWGESLILKDENL